MENKKRFEAPKLKVIRFDEADVIATSGEEYKIAKDKVIRTVEFNPFDGSKQ